MLEQFIKALGIDPVKLQAIAQQYAAELEAFKSGFRQATMHFSDQLNRIEAQNAEILARLDGEKSDDQNTANIVKLEDRRAEG